MITCKTFMITCKNLADGLEKARLIFADDYDLFNDPETPMYSSAAAYGKLLKDSVWL